MATLASGFHKEVCAAKSELCSEDIVEAGVTETLVEKSKAKKSPADETLAELKKGEPVENALSGEVKRSKLKESKLKSVVRSLKPIVGEETAMGLVAVTPRWANAERLLSVSSLGLGASSDGVLIELELSGVASLVLVLANDEVVPARLRVRTTPSLARDVLGSLVNSHGISLAVHF